jgi:hypothetical protein
MNEFDKLATEALQIAKLTAKFVSLKMTDASILEQARYAANRLLFNHPDTAIVELEELLDRRNPYTVGEIERAKNEWRHPGEKAQ